MGDEPRPSDVALLACAVCPREVPKSVAPSSEDEDYVPRFCGPDCYEEWSTDDMAVKMQEVGEPWR
jgi:hypothetical protein